MRSWKDVVGRGRKLRCDSDGDGSGMVVRGAICRPCAKNVREITKRHTHC